MRFQQERRLGDGHNLELTIKPDYVSLDGRRVVYAKYKAVDSEDREDVDLEPGETLQLAMPGTGLSNTDAYQVIAYSVIEGGGSTAERRAFLAVPGHDREMSSAWRAALLEEVPNDVPHLSGRKHPDSWCPSMSASAVGRTAPPPLRKLPCKGGYFTG